MFPNVRAIFKTPPSSFACLFLLKNAQSEMQVCLVGTGVLLSFYTCAHYWGSFWENQLQRVNHFWHQNCQKKLPFQQPITTTSLAPSISINTPKRARPIVRKESLFQQQGDPEVSIKSDEWFTRTSCMNQQVKWILPPIPKIRCNHLHQYPDQIQHLEQRGLDLYTNRDVVQKFRINWPGSLKEKATWKRKWQPSCPHRFRFFYMIFCR